MGLLVVVGVGVVVVVVGWLIVVKWVEIWQ